MPIHFAQLDRRQFLQTVGVGFSVFATSTLAADSNDVEEDVVYLLNDTHIGEKHPEKSAVPSHLRMVVSELVERRSKPAAVIINGDLALKDGQAGDYEFFGRLISPLADSKISTHLTLGNHDHRDVFYDVLKSQKPDSPVVASRHISVIPTKYANFFLLDSLHQTMVTPGTLGADQRQWLSQSLDRFSDRPAIIVAHHNPRLGGDPLHFPGGLTDSVPLWKLLTNRPHVKAYIHGHIHDRTYAEHQGIHILNTPATSYVANPEISTTGWTIARLDARGVTLTTRTTNPDHSWNGQTHRINWN